MFMPLFGPALKDEPEGPSQTLAGAGLKIVDFVLRVLESRKSTKRALY